MKHIYKIVLFFLFFTLLSSQIKASHVSGADITYRWIAGNQYEITVNLYRDCSGITPLGSATVDFVSTCGQSASLLCSLTNAGGTEISQLCSTEVPNSTCNGGALPGMQRYTYKGLITLPAQCDVWTMSWSECCRNTSDNLTSSSSWDMYAESKLYSASFQSNSSPVFTAMPVPYVCQGQPVNYSHGVVESDGDVLVYSLVAALDGGVALAYNAPYSAATPITGITIDAATGQLSFTPTTVGKFVVVIRVDEYTAGGVLKGSVLRDIQFVVQPCTNTVPSVAAPSGVINAATFVGVGAVRTGNFTIGMCEGNSFTFKSIYSDVNAGDVLTYTTNVTTALPGATISRIGTNPTTLTISWTAPLGFPPQTQAFYVTIDDGACPIPGTQTFVYNIQISDQTTAGPDKTYCPGGVATTLDGNGGTTFTWAKLGGGTTYLSCTNCQVPTITAGLPVGVHSYTVTSNLTGCKNKDTVVVVSVASFTFTPTASPATICKYASSTLNAGVAAGVYTYTWSPSTYLTATNTASTVSTPMTSTTYSILATSSTGCSQSRNIAVTVSGVAPISTASAADVTLCTGESTSLNATGFVPPISCAVPGVACAGSTSYNIGTGTSSTTYPTPFVGFYHDGRMQVLYTKAELNAAGILGGVIKTIAFDVATKSSTQAYSGFTVKIGCSSLTALSAFQTGLTTVYSGNYTTSAGINTITFSGNGYAWDGDSNLIIEMCFDNNSYTSSDAVRYTTTTFNSVINQSQDSSPSGGCALNSPSTSTSRPNIQFGICASTSGLTYAWSPATFLSATNISSPTVNAPTASTTYIVTVTSGSCSSTKSVTVNVGAPFTLAMSPDAIVCAGSSTFLLAEPDDLLRTYTYTWTPSTGLSNPAIAGPSASPTANTVYTCDVVSNDGCSRSGSTAITMGPGNLSVTATSSNSNLCLGSSSNLNATVAVAAVTCGTYPSGCSATTTFNGTNANLTGTATNASTSPFSRTNNRGILKQYLYTKADLDAIFGGTGPRVITSIGFNATSTGSIDKLRVGMGCTSLTALTTTFFNGITQVKAAHTATIAATGWNYIDLDTPYQWDGTSNIVIQICSAKSTASAILVNSTAVANTACFKEVNGPGCAETTGALNNNRPNLRIKGCGSSASTLNYAWTPTTGLSSPSTAATVATPTVTTTYQVVATDPGTGCNDTKQLVVQVNRIDAGPDVSVCNSTSTTILATFNGSTAPSSCGPSSIGCASTTNYVIGAGATTSSSPGTTPFYQAYTKQQAQYLYTKAELNAAGITGACTITQLAFKIGTKGSTTPYEGFTIKMGCTALAALPAAFQTGLTTVYSNANYTSVTGSWNTFTLTGSGYDWDGTSNIIVNVCFDKGDYDYTSSDPVEYSTTAFNSVVYDYADALAEIGCSMASPTTTTNRPNIRFAACSYSSTPTYAWTSTPSPRITGATNVSSITTTVLTAPVTYTITATTTLCTLTDKVIATIGSPANLVWDGGTSTDWFTASNWDLNCLPSCNSNVTIPSGTPNMPVIATATTASCDTITIDASATLTMNGTGVLSVCGDFVNNGTLTAAATSTILFGNGSIVQNISGTNTAVNKFGNLTVTKTGGSAILQSDIDIGGNLTTSNATSLLNTNAKYIKLAGHFLNNAGGTTFSNVTNTLEFNGTTVQSYSAGNDNLVLNNVLMNETGTGYVYLMNNMVTGTAGSVTLTSGKIVTNAKEVRVLNTAAGAIGSGNTTSYVEGNLRRKLGASGNYNFAVGHATPGYERIRFSFTGTGGLDNLLVRFDPYGAVPAAPGWSECSATYNLPALDNGFWTADAYNAAFTAIGATTLGTYDVTLYNTAGSYSNSAGANGWTVMKSPSGVSTWALQGTCVISPINAVARATMNGFSKFATAQSSVPLPISLLNFTGKTIAFTNHLEWNTSSEINSDYFILQRSKDGENFENLVRVKAQGNSSNVVNYKETDKEPFITSYYRLMMVDKNGDVKYSEMVTLYLPDNNYNVTIRPNPASNNLFVDIYSSTSSVAQVEILDMVGRIVATKQVDLIEGNNNIDNDLSNVAKGVYFVRLTANNSVLYNGKFIKQ